MSWDQIDFDQIKSGDRVRVVVFGAHKIEATANHHSRLSNEPVHWYDSYDLPIIYKGQRGAEIFRYSGDSPESEPGSADVPHVGGLAPEPEPERQEYWQAIEEITEPVRFALIREFDLSGSSGTGHIADGVLFVDGSVALRWRGEHPSTAVWARIEDAVAVHGHGGFTKVRWIDIPPEWFRRAVGMAM